MLLLSYPLCVHLAVVTQQPYYQVLAIVCLAGGIQYSGLRQGSAFAWGVLLLVVALALWLTSRDLARYILYLPPIVIPLLIASGFLRTLLPGRGATGHCHWSAGAWAIAPGAGALYSPADDFLVSISVGNGHRRGAIALVGVTAIVVVVQQLSKLRAGRGGVCH